MMKRISYLLVGLYLLFALSKPVQADEQFTHELQNTILSGAEVRKTMLQFFVDYKDELTKGTVSDRVEFVKKFDFFNWRGYKALENRVLKVTHSKMIPSYYMAYGSKVFRKLDLPAVRKYYGKDWSDKVAQAVLIFWDQDGLAAYGLEDETPADAKLPPDKPVPFPTRDPKD